MNRNTFVFGIGGTGARVIRALTMLLAAGADPKHTGKIIPVIVDVDAENEDTSRTIKALNLYKRIRSLAYGDTSEKMPGFFGTAVNTLSSQQVTEGDKIQDSFQLKFAGISSTFGSYLRMEDMDAIDSEFLKALYDSSPQNAPGTELNLELTKGFKGNPNIGCIVFNELENSPEFRYFTNAIGEQDRIFIISSIFGGTGSAGFPQLLKLIKHSRNNRVSSAKIGAITVMPYFAVQEDAASAIDSNRFISKTKAALSYYEHEMDQLSAMYYVYDRSGTTPYENHEGGSAQRNDAHLVEMIAAQAALHFTAKPDDSFEAATQYYEYGIRRDEPTLNFSHFFGQSQEAAMKPLTLLTYAAKAYLEYVPRKTGEAFGKEMNLAGELSSNQFFLSLTEFFRQHYWAWLQEMGRNSRAFAPFQLNEGFNNLVTGKPISTGFFDKGLSEGWLDKEFSKIEDRLRKEVPNKERRFLMLLNEVAGKAFSEKLGALPQPV